MRISRIGVLLLVFVLAAASGCALSIKQKAAVSQFSAAAAKLGDATSSELNNMRDDAIKMNTERLLLGGKSKDPNLGNQASLDRGFEMDRVEAIAGATQALAAYGKSLAALVDDTQSAELKAASDDFVASLGNVPGAKDELKDEQMEALGTVVQAVGGFWIEHKRKQAVLQIVKNSQGAIDRLCDLLIRDFNPETGWLVDQLNAIESPLMAEATSGLYDGRTYGDRKVALEGFRLAHISRMRRTEILGRVMKSAQAMKKANRALAKAFEEASWSATDIQEFAGKAQSLQAAIKIIVKE